jgi:outer membrane biogenesis lipoprotein LolB
MRMKRMRALVLAVAITLLLLRCCLCMSYTSKRADPSCHAHIMLHAAAVHW